MNIWFECILIDTMDDQVLLERQFEASSIVEALTTAAEIVDDEYTGEFDEGTLRSLVINVRAL